MMRKKIIFFVHTSPTTADYCTPTAATTMGHDGDNNYDCDGYVITHIDGRTIVAHHHYQLLLLMMSVMAGGIDCWLVGWLGWMMIPIYL